MNSNIETYKQIFIQGVQEANPATNPTLVGGDWDVYGTAIGNIGANLATSIQNIQNANFTQFQSGNQLDYEAFSLGQPPRLGAIYANVIANPITYPFLPYTFNAGTQFTSTFNGNRYTLQASVFVPTSVPTPPTAFSLQCNNPGSGNQLPYGDTLTNTVNPAISLTVVSSTDGQNAETDAQLRRRLLYVKQNPPGAGRVGDWYTWGFESSTQITGMNVVPQFSTGTVGVFCLSGSSNYDAILTNPIYEPYTRTSPPAIVSYMINYVNTKRGLNSLFVGGSVATYFPANLITIQVVLPTGITLSTVTTNFNGESITVQNFILQEFRRGFITYPMNGTSLTAGSAVLLTSKLQQVLDSSLSYYTGAYAQLLIDRTIIIDSGAVQNIPVPYYELDSSGNLYSVYDITPSNITITQVT